MADMAGPPGDDAARRQRALLDGAAGVLYAEVVERGLLAADDARSRPEHPEHEALQVLCDLGLLRPADDAEGWVAVDPGTVQSGVVVPISRDAVTLLAEGAAWGESFGRLAQAYRTAAAPDGALTQLRGLEPINRFLEAAVEDSRTELLTAHPAGARRAQVQAAAVARDRRALARGVRIRTLYQHTARHSRSMREYVDAMRHQGAQIRTLDEFFKRLIVIDRRLALIPGDAPATAVVIRDSRVVAYLVDVFERSWERGRDYTHETKTTATDIATEVRQLTVRMLTEGHSDSASAKRVGVSTRTYASYVAALKQEYGVQTRFQLGLAMGRTEPQSSPESSGDSGS